VLVVLETLEIQGVRAIAVVVAVVALAEYFTATVVVFQIGFFHYPVAQVVGALPAALIFVIQVLRGKRLDIPELLAVLVLPAVLDQQVMQGRHLLV